MSAVTGIRLKYHEGLVHLMTHMRPDEANAWGAFCTRNEPTWWYTGRTMLPSATVTCMQCLPGIDVWDA